jgi:hypothetical protein
MSTNIGTLINATIRPSDTLDRISTAWDNEIRGGHHSYPTLNQRDSIIIQRRSWGMLCSVYNDGDNNGTYQLVYGKVDNDINNNLNWVKTQIESSDELYWLSNVKSILINEPSVPSDGDRYITGLNDNFILSGSNWSLPEYLGGLLVTWNSNTSNWDKTTPKNGYSIRVDDQSNQLYTYSGDYPDGTWVKESIGVISLTASSIDGISYTSNLTGVVSYNSDQSYLVVFSDTNLSTSATLNINGIGALPIRKQTSNGITSNLLYNDLNPNLIYTLYYKDNSFIFNKPYNTAPFDIKWKIRTNETIQVPDYNEYIVYGDLDVEGRLDIDTYGRVIILNGGLNVKGGTVSNYGNVQMVNFNGPNSNYVNSITKFSTTISMTSGVTYSIIHGLNTQDIVVNTWDEVTGENIFVNVTKTSNNQIDILAENYIPSVRVVVIG